MAIFDDFLSPQINGADMKTATHDFAVSQLTDPQRFVRLVVEREIKGPLEPPQSPRSPSLINNLSKEGYLANRPSKRKTFAKPFRYSLIPSAGYRRSIGDLLDPNLSKSPATVSSTNTTTTPSSVDGKRTNGVETPQPTVPQPAPRTRLSSQNSVPLANGTEPRNGSKSSTTPKSSAADEEPQVSRSA
jgi:hypothetical protein